MSTQRRMSYRTHLILDTKINPITAIEYSASVFFSFRIHSSIPPRPSGLLKPSRGLDGRGQD